MLLRHWTLHDSIYNSNYVIAQLGLKNDPAQIRFKELLAKIGVPI